MRALSFCFLLLDCHRADSPAAPGQCSRPRLNANRSTEVLSIDGELAETGWLHTANSGPLRNAGTGAPISPHTEFRAMWNDSALFLGLYAADQDLQDSDAMNLALDTPRGTATIKISPRGKLECSGACPPPRTYRVAVDIDEGTIGDSSDEDEEWVTELELRWAALGFMAAPASVSMDVWRTDSPKRSAPRTVAWSLCPQTGRGTLALLR